MPAHLLKLTARQTYGAIKCPCAPECQRWMIMSDHCDDDEMVGFDERQAKAVVELLNRMEAN